jgi:hypothetical protein
MALFNFHEVKYEVLQLECSILVARIPYDNSSSKPVTKKLEQN